MKPFNLKKALDGAPVITRGGLRVSEIYHFKTALHEDEYPISAVINGEIRSFCISGNYLGDVEEDESEYDLFMEEIEHIYYAKIISVTDAGPWLSEVKTNSLERAKVLWPNAAIAKITWKE